MVWLAVVEVGGRLGLMEILVVDLPQVGGGGAAPCVSEMDCHEKQRRIDGQAACAWNDQRSILD